MRHIPGPESTSVQRVHLASAILVIMLLLSGFVVAEVFAVDRNLIWVEAEDAIETNFSPGVTVEAVPNGPTGWKYLRLYESDQAKSESSLPFHAVYRFTVQEDGLYYLWMGSTPQNAGWSSPFFYRVDEGQWKDLKGKKWASNPYGHERFFGWFLADAVSLKAGQHVLRIEVRGPRAVDTNVSAFLDAFILTTDPKYVPSGNRPAGSPHPTWEDAIRHKGVRGLEDELNFASYQLQVRKIDGEEATPAIAAEVVRKLRGRPLPKIPAVGVGTSRPTRFGVHGMDAFIDVGINDEQTTNAYDLMARAGVQTFRTAESCWHRLGENFDQFGALDYEADQAFRYGQTLMLTVGYPPPKYTVGNFHLSPVKPEYEARYREYLQAVFERYKDKGVVEFAEVGNEVDAPRVWWRGGTPQMYVDEVRITREMAQKLDPSIKIAAFAATYSRYATRPNPDEGREFVRKCFDLGIDKHADAYALHYTWPLAARDFTAFFRDELDRVGAASKPLLNTEETGYNRPSDVLKVFARDLFLYGYERVDYFLARDYYEGGRLLFAGLFDFKWRPKLRLLSYALAVDAMKDRQLVGLARPADGVEAYVLQNAPGAGSAVPTYSIVMWRNDPRAAENLGVENSMEPTKRTPLEPVKVSGFGDVVSAFNWKLDPIPAVNESGSVMVADDPVVVFLNKRPAWELTTPEQWLANVNQVVPGVPAMVPDQVR